MHVVQTYGQSCVSQQSDFGVKSSTLRELRLRNEMGVPKNPGATHEILHEILYKTVSPRTQGSRILDHFQAIEVCTVPA